MNRKTLAGLAVVTAAVVIGAVAVVASRQSATQRAALDTVVLPDLMARINDVDRIAVAGPDAEFTLRLDGERWVAPDLADFPADFDKVKKALIGLAELRAIEEKTSDPERYGALGLAEPDAGEGGGKWVRLFAGDEALAALMVGEPGRGGADRVYVRHEGEAETWLARGELDLGDTAKDWVDTMILRLDGDRVRRVTIDHADGERLALARESRDAESFDLLAMPEGATLRSPLTLDNLGRALAFLRFDEVAAASGGPESGAGDSTAAFETFDGATVTVTLENRGEDETWARIDAAWDPAAAAPPPAQEEAENGEAAEEDAAEDEEPFDPGADVARVAARTADWVFRIPNFKAEQLGMRLVRLIDLPGEGGEEDESGAASDLIPGSAPPPVITLD